MVLLLRIYVLIRSGLTETNSYNDHRKSALISDCFLAHLCLEASKRIVVCQNRVWQHLTECCSITLSSQQTHIFQKAMSFILNFIELYFKLYFKILYFKMCSVLVRTKGETVHDRQECAIISMVYSFGKL